MTTALEKAIAGLYEAFASEPKPPTIEGCACCIDEKDVKLLLSKPLRSLTPDDLSNYAQRVLLTVGSEADFKYFLPRILEILAIEDGWWPDPEVIGTAITNSHWTKFSAIQQNAIRQFFREVLTDLIKANDGHGIDQWICAIARSKEDLKPYLCLVGQNPPALIAFFEQNSESLHEGRLENAFWSDEPQNQKILLDWFQSKHTKDLINKAYGLE